MTCMKRYAVYDPPEYQNWTPEPSVMSEFRARVSQDPIRKSVVAALTPRQHVALYQGLVRNRLHDIALKRWVRQGVISKAWLGTGEEAVTVGAVHALQKGDVVGPMIRNAGACHEMGMPLVDVLRAYLGTADSPTGGRDLHFGDLSKGVVSPISMVGALGAEIEKESGAEGRTGFNARHSHLLYSRAEIVLQKSYGVNRNRTNFGSLPADEPGRHVTQL